MHLRNVFVFVFAFFSWSNALFTDQLVQKNAFVTLKLDPTGTIYSLKIILLQYFQ